MSHRSQIPAAAWSQVWPSISGRGAVAVMFCVFALCDLSAAWLHVPGLTGFGFAAGSAAAAGCTRRQHLLVIATTPPVIFLAAVTCAELIEVHLRHAPGAAGLVLAGVLLTMTAAAPWLFCGLAGALVIATVRGLPQCVRDLRAGLACAESGPVPAHSRPAAGHEVAR